MNGLARHLVEPSQVGDSLLAHTERNVRKLAELPHAETRGVRVLAGPRDSPKLDQLRQQAMDGRQREARALGDLERRQFRRILRKAGEHPERTHQHSIGVSPSSPIVIVGHDVLRRSVAHPCATTPCRGGDSP